MARVPYRHGTCAIPERALEGVPPDDNDDDDDDDDDDDYSDVMYGAKIGGQLNEYLSVMC